MAQTGFTQIFGVQTSHGAGRHAKGEARVAGVDLGQGGAPG